MFFFCPFNTKGGLQQSHWQQWLCQDEGEGEDATAIVRVVGERMVVGHPGRKSVEKRLDLDSLLKESTGVADNVEGERKKGRQRG